MVHNGQNSNPKVNPSMPDTIVEIELNKAPIVWDLENGNFSFFGLDTAFFWTNPSLLRMLSPLVEEVGNDLFRLLLAHSSSLGTEEDYHAMVSALGSNFKEGFLAWGKAVSTAGWGVFEMPEYNPDNQQACVIIYNPWEMSMQKDLTPEKRWGCPFIQGKVIGIFNHAFRTTCWANDICYYDADPPFVELKVYPSKTTIKNQIEILRYERMAASEKNLSIKVEQKTFELQLAQNKIENYSKTLEKKVAERTAELSEINKQLKNEIKNSIEAEAKKEMLIQELQTTLEEIKTLKGIIPICMHCKGIRDDKGAWNKLEKFITEHSDAQFSHGLCEECLDKYYPEEEDD